VGFLAGNWACEELKKQISSSVKKPFIGSRLSIPDSIFDQNTKHSSLSLDVNQTTFCESILIKEFHKRALKKKHESRAR